MDPEKRVATAVLTLANLVIGIALLSFFFDFW